MKTILIIFVLLSQFANAGTVKHITIGASVESNTYAGKWARLVLTEAFKRLNIKLKMPVYPLMRVELLANEGKIDGECRVFDYGLSKPNLIRSGETGVIFSFILYSSKKDLKFNTLNDLQKRNDLVIENLIGVKVCENFLRETYPGKSFAHTTETIQGIQKLISERMDLYCDIDLNVLNVLHDPRFENWKNKIQKAYTIKSSIPLFLYLHKKHKSLAPQVEKVLKDMNKEGLIEEYRLKTEKELGWSNR